MNQAASLFLILGWFQCSYSFTILAGQARPKPLRALLPAENNKITGEVRADFLPNTFRDCAAQAAQSARQAILDGYRLMEVEFPPLPLEYMEGSASAAGEIANANTRWAIYFAQCLKDRGPVFILYPDKDELHQGVEYSNSDTNGLYDVNITLTTARADPLRNAASIDQLVRGFLDAARGGTVKHIPTAAMYVAIVSSTQELPELEQLHLQAPDVPIVLFNLRLDTLRGDLGLPFFPNREFHHRFLSRVKPVFYMRSRAFSTTLNKAPYILNYSGMQYRAYPGPYRAFLTMDDKKSRIVKVTNARPTNQELCDALIAAVDAPGLTTDMRKTRGSSVWWEKETGRAQSDNWRT